MFFHLLDSCMFYENYPSGIYTSWTKSILKLYMSNVDKNFCINYFCWCWRFSNFSERKICIVFLKLKNFLEIVSMWEGEGIRAMILCLPVGLPLLTQKARNYPTKRIFFKLCLVATELHITRVRLNVVNCYNKKHVERKKPVTGLYGFD